LSLLINFSIKVNNGDVLSTVAKSDVALTLNLSVGVKKKKKALI